MALSLATVVILRLGLLLLFLSSITTVSAQYASTYPAPMPLFHKSPYFSAWIDASSNLSSFPMGRRPRPAKSIANKPAVGWYTGIRVDGTSYRIQGIYGGGFNGTASTVAAYITPTRTIFTIDTGPVRLNLTYLTPIELQDWTLHSFPFAYAFIDIWATDSNPHRIQVYTDIAGQFLSSDDSTVIVWNTTTTTKSIYHVATQSIPQPLTENNDMSEDGTQILAFGATPGVSMTWKIANYGPTRDNFTSLGHLDNTSDSSYRAISNGSPAFAFALDLGTVNQTSNPLVFAIGLVRDPVLKYQTAATNQNLRHLWWTRWRDIGSAIDDFLAGSTSALSRAIDLDNRIVSSATASASRFNITSTAANLTDLYILSLRQTVGSLEFTTPKSTLGGTNDVKVFMKDVGYSRRINPVEVLYASFPTFLFLNTSIAGALLEPLLEFQSSALYKNNYAAPDLGNSWPIIKGNTTDQSLLGIDSCGAMLIMALAHAQKSGDGRLLFRYYDLFRRWADFLVESTPKAGSYMSSDRLNSSHSNLAVKGITGLYAMGKINNVLESRGADPSKTLDYLNKARTYIQQWQDRALSSDHVMSTYGSNETWALLYNFYAPRLIAADLLPEYIYERQASWYANQSRTAQRFGLPYDSSLPQRVKAHWTLLSAGSVFNSISGGRDTLINQVHARSFAQSGSDGNPADYPSREGGSSSVTGVASPAMGAVYSFLALTLPDVAVNLPSGSLPLNGSPRPSRLPSILGGIFGALGGLILIVSVLFFLRRRRRKQSVIEVDHFHDEFLTEAPQQSAGPAFLREKKMGRTIESMTDITVRGSSVPGSSSRGVGSTVSDNELRRDVEQLRMVVETLTAQQSHQVMYPDDMPDEPPPRYAGQP